jgi:ABC-type branched-subunit amino acid transport system permease subunit/aromatic ring-opening dioxygenase catalytic subunit (LigB family)
MTGRIDALFAGPRGIAWLGALLVVLVLLPTILPAQSYITYILFTFFLFATFGHAWNLLAGYCGLLSFGNQVFVGIGGFATAILHYYGGVNVWLALLIAGLVSAGFAYLLAIPISEDRQGKASLGPVGIAIVLWIVYEIAIAYAPSLDVFGSAYVRRVVILLLIFLGALPLLRLQGAYFGVATWLIASAAASVFSEAKIVGAGAGMQIKTSATQTQLYYAALGLMVVATATLWRLLRSRYGLALTAVRDDEEAARTVGIDIRAMKMVALVLAGAATGMAGGLYFVDTVIITPGSAFTVFWSAYFVFIAVAGGMGTLAGPIVGAAIYVALDRLISAYVGQGLLIFGAASIIMMFVMPRGVMGIVHDLRSSSVSGRRDRFEAWRRLLLGTSERARSARRRDVPGVVGAFLVPGSPLPLMRQDNPVWAPLIAGYAAVRGAVEELRPDALIVYSTQWIAVLDQLWQVKPRIVGLHVDENWHDFGNLRYDIRIDSLLARACVAAATAQGITSKPVEYDGFPIDSGTIVMQNFVNPRAEVPLVIAANNIYHDWDQTQRLGELAAAQAVAQGKRVVVMAIGGLSGTMFREDIDLGEDRIARDSDDVWNREILRRLVEGDVAELPREISVFCREARVDMGFKHFAFLLGALGGKYQSAKLLGYAPVYGAGAAIMEFVP